MPDNARLIELVGYPDMQMAIGGAGEMLADYWGVQKGACVSGVPCGALRNEIVTGLDVKRNELQGGITI